MRSGRVFFFAAAVAARAVTAVTTVAVTRVNVTAARFFFLFGFVCAGAIVFSLQALRNYSIICSMPISRMVLT